MANTLLKVQLMKEAARKVEELAEGRSWYVQQTPLGYYAALYSPKEEEESWLCDLDLLPAIPQEASAEAAKGFTVVSEDPYADVSVRYGLREEVLEYRKVLRTLMEP